MCLMKGILLTVIIISGPVMGILFRFILWFIMVCHHSKRISCLICKRVKKFVLSPYFCFNWSTVENSSCRISSTKKITFAYKLFQKNWFPSTVIFLLNKIDLVVPSILLKYFLFTYCKNFLIEREQRDHERVNCIQITIYKFW